LTQIAERHSSTDHIVVVSHNFPIVGIVCRVTGTHLNHYRNFHLDPCGISRLRRDSAGRWQVTQVNSQEYPPPADPQN
jgi:broad specificity phosphatase PhoE